MVNRICCAQGFLSALFSSQLLYLKILQSTLLGRKQLIAPDCIFPQDNTPIHTARKVSKVPPRYLRLAPISLQLRTCGRCLKLLFLQKRRKRSSQKYNICPHRKVLTFGVERQLFLLPSAKWYSAFCNYTRHSTSSLRMLPFFIYMVALYPLVGYSASIHEIKCPSAPPMIARNAHTPPHNYLEANLSCRRYDGRVN